MTHGEYPQHEWYENLQKGLEALAKNPDKFNGKLLKQARKSYELVKILQKNATRIIQLIESNPRYKKFKNTAIYDSCKRDIPLLQEILEKYKVIEEYS